MHVAVPVVLQPGSGVLLAFMLSFLLLPAALANFDVNLLITSEVRGAVYPVNSWNLQCKSDADSCDCVGGAARRRGYLGAGTETDKPNTVALDTGAYFSGSGKFFPAFDGNASAEFFAASSYSAHGLTYRDFSAAGPDSLARYLTHMRSLSSRPADTVVSNFNATGDSVLGSLISTCVRAHNCPLASHSVP